MYNPLGFLWLTRKGEIRVSFISKIADRLIPRLPQSGKFQSELQRLLFAEIEAIDSQIAALPRFAVGKDNLAVSAYHSRLVQALAKEPDADRQLTIRDELERIAPIATKYNALREKMSEARARLQSEFTTVPMAVFSLLREIGVNVNPNNTAYEITAVRMLTRDRWSQLLKPYCVDLDTSQPRRSQLTVK